MKSDNSGPASSILFVRASRALRALDALATGLNVEGALSHARAEAFDTFQRDFLRSGIGPLQSSLLSITSQNSHPQLSTALDTAHLALDYATSAVSADRTATQAASRMVDELRHSASGAALKARHASVVNRGIEGGVVEGDVQYEMDRARIALEEGFNGRWNWLALIARLRVDDVGMEIGAYLDRRFGKILEQQVSKTSCPSIYTSRSSSRPASSHRSKRCFPSNPIISSDNSPRNARRVSKRLTHFPHLCCSTTFKPCLCLSHHSRRHLSSIRSLIVDNSCFDSPYPVSNSPLNDRFYRPGSSV